MAKRFVVDWADVARTDLDELLDYLEQDEPGVALPVLDRLEQAAKRLESMPLRGRVVPELARRNIRLYRELIVRPWRIIYRVGTARVLVLAVLDGRRDLEGLLLSRVLRRT
ncbi:type II toxin-antitoxin system RelE/ParE family toxin [Archangium violaceum]|uniref:type II toxin-antitoxin system RelE/ParE family toxin n=1 Tax=Archangium violaceum TaxID=83451 RepID=UPI002B2C42FC|nr:type II toxin-antitoxin system RelE/ParE family toxin [Archangium violaceum]